jgi:hypothetical protein
MHTVSGTVAGQQLAPLLLHPFLERLFAGLDAAPLAVATIRSEVRANANEVSLTLERTTEEALPLTYRADAAIKAALRRLALHYPNQHTVHLTETEQLVRVQLTIRF